MSKAADQLILHMISGHATFATPISNSLHTTWLGTEPKTNPLSNKIQNHRKLFKEKVRQRIPEALG